MKLATYTKEDTFDHTAAEGFIKIYGLPSKIYNKVNKEKFAKVKKVLKRKK
jgi:argininosuccinate synthase